MKINTERLKNLLGSEASAQKFVDLFQLQWPGQLQELQKAFVDQDWATAENTAHALKSQCRYLGLDEAADLLQEIELDPAGTGPQKLEQVMLLFDRLEA